MSYNRAMGHVRGKRSYGTDYTKKLRRSISPIKPVDVGKAYDVDINEITGKGDGIARVQGFIVFVENGK